MSKRGHRKEAANERKIRILQRKVRTLQSRDKYKSIKIIVKLILVTLPLWAVLLFSFDADFSLELSPFGIGLFLLVYFGTLGMYFYFKYRRAR